MAPLSAAPCTVRIDRTAALLATKGSDRYQPDGRSPVAWGIPRLNPMPEIDSATAARPSAPLPRPSVRSPRAWLLAVTESAVSLAIGGMLWIVFFGELLIEFNDEPPASLLALHVTDLLIGLLIGLLVGAMRFLPATRVGTAVHLIATALAGLSAAAMPALLILLYRLGRVRRLPVDLTALGLGIAGQLGVLLYDISVRGETLGITWLYFLIVVVAIALTVLVLGRLSGTRAVLVASLRQQAESSERERRAAEQAREAAEAARASAEQARASAEAQARAEERTAIARDMHDSISHHLATIAMHAGAMSYRKDLPPERLREIASTVRDAAQQANTELREVLVALRSGDDTQPLATAPSLQGIVDRARLHGQDVSLTWQGVDPEALDERGRSTVVALSRVLSELVVNASKHAPDQPLAITLARHEDRLVISAENAHPRAQDSSTPAASQNTSTAEAQDPEPTDDQPPIPVPSTGHGLIGVQERARLLGGDARVDDDGSTFRVEAWMPW